MPVSEAEPYNIKDLSLDVRLTAIVNGVETDFTGKKLFSVDFFRKSIGFGITDIDIEVNTSLQPIITITFKDLYGNTVFGKSVNNNSDLSSTDTNNDADFSILFNWPPPKFLFTFKGFLGRSATWMLNMKKSSVSYDSSDGSYNIKCEFVPNQWGFLSDLPFLYLLAVKALKKKSGVDMSKVQSIFDLIKIGKQVEVKTQETTKEFDTILKQMTLLKSMRIYDALNISKVINYGDSITGQVGNQTIPSFNRVAITAQPTGEGNTDIDTPEKMKSLATNSENLTRISAFLLFSSQVGNINPLPDLTYKKISTGKLNEIIPNFEQEKNTRIKVLTDNISQIEDAIKRKTYDSSKDQLEKITIGEIFKQLAEDSGYIMGKILEAGYDGYNDPQFKSIRDDAKGLIGKSFPMVLTDDKKEEKPATTENLGFDVGVETHELQFVNDFIDAISEGIATELAEDDSAAESIGDNLIKKRINNVEALKGNPYKPFYQNIAENILVRSGIAAYLTRSPDPNRPGDYDTTLNRDRATTAADIFPLADADLENITDVIISQLSEDDFKSLKTFCIFWDNLLTEDCENLRGPKSGTGELVQIDSSEGGNVDDYSTTPGGTFSTVSPPVHISTSPVTIMNYPVMIEKPANWDGNITTAPTGLMTKTLRQITQEIFRPISQGAGSIDATNSAFIDLDNLQGKKLINNGIAYFKAPNAVNSDVYTYVMFDGPDANKTQGVMSAESDSEIKNDADKQKDSDQPLGFVNIQNPMDKDNNLVAAVVEMNNRIDDGLLLNYPRMINPSNAFFTNNTSLSDVENYFLVNAQLGDPDNLPAGDLPAKNIAVSIAYHSSKSSAELVFGPFVTHVFEKEDDSIVQRGYIKRICSKLREKLDGIEQKRNQVISDTLGKAGDQIDLLYKQMHVLYQQWEVLIIKDSDSANGQNTNPDTTPGAISTELQNRYSNHENFDIPRIVSNEAADNTFIYAYPMSFFNGGTKVNVKNSIINIEPLYKPNGNTTILNIIQQICTKNNFIFIPMPGESSSFNTSEIFSPHLIDQPKVKNFFYVQFAPTPESRATLGNNDNSPLSSVLNAKDKSPDGTILFKFGSASNQILKNITVDTQESKATAESIVNLQRLVDNENQNKKVTTDCSMLPVMEGRSYKATADMLGNAQIFPMQFFYLDSIPLFNGLYQIMKVKHTIKPNDMTTSAEGIRMRMDAQTGDFGGVFPITLDTLAALPELTTAPPAILGPGDFANAIADQGSGVQDNQTGTNAAGSSSQVAPVLTSKGGLDIVPNSVVTTTGIILPPDLRAVQGAIRLTQSTNANGAAPIADHTTPAGVLIKKEDIIRDMNQFIQDVLGPFATFLKQNYPALYKNWNINSATRGFIPTGGSKTSQHQYGQAVDSQIVGKARGIETAKMNLQLLNAILTWYQTNPVGYGQLLFETRKPDSAWIHWSYKRNNNKIQLLRFNDDHTNQACKINTTGAYVLPGITESQIILNI